MNTEADRENALTLEILDAVERNERVSQRHLARHLGVALGLANSYLKRCISKGWVKVQQAPANRYLYYLTPTGFREKSRLTAEYLKTSLGFYREASESCCVVLDNCERNHWNRILLCGMSDLAEIAILRSLERNLTVVGIYDPASRRESFLGKPIWRHFEDVHLHDARLLTDISASQERYDEIKARGGEPSLLVPDILRLNTR